MLARLNDAAQLRADDRINMNKYLRRAHPFPASPADSAGRQLHGGSGRAKGPHRKTKGESIQNNQLWSDP